MKGDVPEGYYTLPIGKADVKREGSDVTIFAVGKQVNTALKAAEQLAARESKRRSLIREACRRLMRRRFWLQ